MDLNNASPTLLSDFRAHETRAWHISWSADGKYLASCGEDKTVRIWNQRASTGEWLCRQTLDGVHDKAIRRTAFSPDGKYLAACSFDATASVYERSGTGGHENELKSVQWNLLGTMIATCSRDKTIWIWEMCPGHSQDVKNIAWHPTRQVATCVFYDDTVKVWGCVDEAGCDEWHCLETLTEHQATVWDLAFNEFGTQFCTVGDNNEFILWSCGGTTSQPTIKKLANIVTGHSRSIYTVAWSKKNLIATGSGDNSLRLFGLENETLVPLGVKLKAHESDINCVCWNPVNDTLASCGDDGRIKIWRV